MYRSYRHGMGCLLSSAMSSFSHSGSSKQATFLPTVSPSRKMPGPFHTVNSLGWVSITRSQKVGVGKNWDFPQFWSLGVQGQGLLNGCLLRVPYWLAHGQLSSSMFSKVTLASKICTRELWGHQHPVPGSQQRLLFGVSGYFNSSCSFTPKFQSDSAHFYMIKRPHHHLIYFCFTSVGLISPIYVLNLHYWRRIGNDYQL